MAKMFRVTDNMRAQQANADKLMGEYCNYAVEIGCTYLDGMIGCTAAQSKLLKAWWEKRTAENAAQKKGG